MKTPNNYDRKMFMHPECFSSPLVHAFVLNFAQLFRDINQVDFNLRSNNVSNFSANQKKSAETSSNLNLNQPLSSNATALWLNKLSSRPYIV